MVIYANELENDASISIFFFAKRRVRVITSVSITKNNGGKNARELSIKIRKKTESGSIGTPTLSQVCFMSINQNIVLNETPYYYCHKPTVQWLANTLV